MNKEALKSCDGDQIFDHKGTAQMKNNTLQTYNDQIFDHTNEHQITSSNKTSGLIADNLETGNDFRVIPRNFFPTHTSVNETHLAKVYGNSIMKQPVTAKQRLMESIKDLKYQVSSKIKQKLKDRMVKVGNKKQMTYYNVNGKKYFVRLYHDLKLSYASDIRRNNLENIFHVCYGNFDLDVGWMHTLEHEIMQELELKYSDLQNKSTDEVKAGRPQSTSLVMCIAIAKNDLVKGIIYYGSEKHGLEIRVKHTKGREPGIFQEQFIVKKPKNIEGSIKHFLIDDDTKMVDDKLLNVDDHIECEDYFNKNIKYDEELLISKLRNKIKIIEEENKKLKRELGVAENLLTSNKKDSSFSNAKEIQKDLNKKQKKNKQEIFPPTSPTFSFLTTSSDITEVREFKTRVKNNRKRNAKFEKQFKKTKEKIMKQNNNKKRKNQYTDMDTVSPISAVSSKITLDTLEKKVQRIHFEKVMPESSDKDESDDSENSDTDETVSKQNTFNINNIDDQKKENDNKSQNINESDNNNNKNSTLENDETEYIFQSIIGHKRKQNKYLFEVKWQNYDQTSWENKTYLDSFVCDDVTKYLSSLKIPSKKKQKAITNKDKQEFQDEEDKSVCYNQQLDCLHEAICLREESNSAYCLKGNILYNVRCAECNQIFEKLTHQNHAHICKNIARGCSYALCQNCFTMKLVNEMRPTRKRGRITSISI